MSALAVELEAAGPEAAVAWAVRRFMRGRVGVVTGLQSDGVAVAAMALAIDPAVRILTIDTGRLPAETFEYLDRLRALWRRDIEVIRPAPARVVDLVSTGGPELFHISVEDRLRCCSVRKVEPLDTALLGIDAWLTGLRRDQTASRAGLPVVQGDPLRPGVVKINPLAALSEDDVVTWLTQRDIPLHPLYARGYRSIGCAPCTRATAPGEPARAGRWWWEQGVASECGMHVTPPAVARNPT